MCGIAGVMSVDGSPIDESICERLEGALRHRGPDGAGRFNRDGVALVHTRLAIVGLESGAQPLFGERGATLIVNGEIYNDLELRAGLLSDVRFATSSDSESILRLYERFGPEAVSHLRGMYTFALHDADERCLMLSRDPFGIKQLYYAELPGLFAFASEPGALVAAGLVGAACDRNATVELLQLQFTTGADTIFHGIKRLLPGQTIIVRDGRIAETRWMPALPEGGPVSRGESEALADLDSALMDSVHAHQRSDVPFGLFLSSGIDSTAILACMTRLNGTPIRAYTASFPGTGVADEYPDAHRNALRFGADHIKVDVTEEDFWAELPAIAAAVDDPTADYAVVPTYLLAREAAKDVKVVLCGEGGDELFAGYGRYRRQIRPWWLGGRPRKRKGPFSAPGLLRDLPSQWREGVAGAERASALPGRSRLQVAQAADCVDYLPHGLLVKLDRCLMAHGLEGRTPFLDPKLAEFGFRLPQNLLLARRRGKYLLRRWLDQQAEGMECFARKKGFTVPVGEWIAARGSQLAPLMAADPAVTELCDPSAVRHLFASGGKQDQQAAWRLLFFALWHRRHIRGLPPQGDVFECLSAV